MPGRLSTVPRLARRPSPARGPAPRRRRRAAPGALVALVLVGALATPARADATPATGWTGTACGTLTRVPVPFALDLGNDGFVVGYDTRLRTMSWHAATGDTRWYGGIEGGLRSELTAVSPGGRVAGVAHVRGERYEIAKAVRVDGPLPLVPVDRSPSRYDSVRAVNDANTVVGASDPVGSPGRTEAFVWADQRRVLAPPPGAWSSTEALAINASGWVLGWGAGTDATGSFRRQVLLWSPTGAVTALPPLADGAQLVPVALADDGRVIGYRTRSDGRGDAVVTWTAAGGYVVVPAPTPDGSPVELQVSDADADGTVLGATYDARATPPLRPFLYDAHSGFRLLVDQDGTALPTVPQAVNDGHQTLLRVGAHPHLWTPCD
ncbi:hypothetical protein [Cellulomonas fimi]|uniref:Extracellular repeat protein, HAF family n=1 Tax=Cellulomonas fimi (strain ATCC 484 / DSM 20113 / JCM 1341 / CCUG 24087 / LMG 16345 / NBRC 15513 / NCIMB 8980 / NCTC 7547 / NRS-133) TaxID=590998 RepID=F4GZH8_CELFA|nr:hypothetical protein [Cellulomonas fimi]AEE44899.1 hypothetical protein Celf_0759 [Cellulomonas fimi ATCC 484]NNH08271.1 hypothetical protein [Cellulomonas fimi]VEH27619.1 Uncharacterised protein [Cellulomonas fimi]